MPDGSSVTREQGNGPIGLLSRPPEDEYRPPPAQPLAADRFPQTFGQLVYARGT